MQRLHSYFGCIFFWLSRFQKTDLVPKSYTFLRFPTLRYAPETRFGSNFHTLSYTSYTSYTCICRSYAFLHFPTLSYAPETRSGSGFPTLSYGSYTCICRSYAGIYKISHLHPASPVFLFTFSVNVFQDKTRTRHIKFVSSGKAGAGSSLTRTGQDISSLYHHRTKAVPRPYLPRSMLASSLRHPRIKSALALTLYPALHAACI